MPRKLTGIVVPKRLLIKLVNAAFCAWQWESDDYLDPDLLKTDPKRYHKTLGEAKGREKTYLAARKLLYAEDK